MFEDTNIKIYGCVKSDTEIRFASANITFHTISLKSDPNYYTAKFIERYLGSDFNEIAKYV